MRSILQDLAPLQAFLDKFNMEGGRKDAETRDVELKIKRFALQAEDQIEIHLSNIIVANLKDATKLKEEDTRRELRGSLGEIRKEIGGLSQIVNNHSDTNDDSSKLPSHHQEIPSQLSADKWRSQTTHEVEMVGNRVELAEIEQFVRYHDGPKSPNVLSIWGMGGIGNTTLARKVYEDSMKYFSVCAWVTVSQKYELKQIITSLLRCITTITPEEIKEATEDELACQLGRLMKGRTYLIVVDDIWSTRAWDEIIRLFPYGSKGCFILLTTQDREVAMYASKSEFVPLKFLRVLASVPSRFLERENLGNMVFLRYVHVKQWFEGLEDIVPTNPNLQVLIVSHKGTIASSRRLSSKIWETPKLIRHVEVSSSLSVDPPPPSEVRESLQTLYWLRLHHCTKEVFSRIPNVKKLGIICGGDKGSISPTEDNLGNLGYLGELKTLMIAFQKGSPTGLQNLKSLSLHLNIKKLKLKRTCLPWSEINVVGMLPNLEVLKLKEASNGSNWNPSLQGNFCKLKFLYVEAKNLVCWEIFDGEQFLCLKHLVLKRCTQLEAIPIGFAVVNTLESVELLNCSLHRKEYVHNFMDIRESYGCNPIVIRHVDQTPEVEEEEEDDLFSYTPYQG
nr:putative late blight resistance protein homolog R1A-4 isoform X1 [Ipomoea batatas]